MHDGLVLYQREFDQSFFLTLIVSLGPIILVISTRFSARYCLPFCIITKYCPSLVVEGWK
ncbi:hypothetical protein BSR03_20300 [Serratia proteamaculans]|nr:hypothetical protein BSR03_20300 [Serratia proteamaculans]